jgi:hypothetical protein
VNVLVPGHFLLPLEDTGIEKTKIYIKPQVNYPSSKDFILTISHADKLISCFP